MSAQDETLDRYHILMRLNAQAHALRIARELGIFRILMQGQKTAEQIATALQVNTQVLTPLLDSLVAMKVLEQYQDDFAIAAVTRLLCNYDSDLGDSQWLNLEQRLRGGHPTDEDAYFDSAAATQWIHTGAAKQAAEILDIGGERKGLRVLDLGCGSAVWSAAMAYVDPLMTVVAADTPQRLEAAKSTIESIGLGDRFTFLEQTPETGAIPEGPFDLILLAGRITSTPAEEDRATFEKLHSRLSDVGEIAIIDLFQSPGTKTINETIEALRIVATTRHGEIRDATAMRASLQDAGFEGCQFAFLAASRQGWGLMLARKSP